MLGKMCKGFQWSNTDLNLVLACYFYWQFTESMNRLKIRVMPVMMFSRDTEYIMFSNFNHSTVSLLPLSTKWLGHYDIVFVIMSTFCSSSFLNYRYTRFYLSVSALKLGKLYSMFIWKPTRNILTLTFDFLSPYFCCHPCLLHVFACNSVLHKSFVKIRVDLTLEMSAATSQKWEGKKNKKKIKNKKMSPVNFCTCALFDISAGTQSG